ncbi:MAG TPA: hypothetical protein DCZ92_02505 [Elusimicrobia bacterium]|nr:MAG: hypothetical protein A2016_00250 [Elusimicrobia bacterium GWF2_62_30]HBA59695.1 hypothetical protein [Elusimicrobiota bacterium]
MEKNKTSGRYFALHAHFYQPPRENPWTGAIPPQPSAWPFHDWNSRIARECYLPNSAARINDSSGRTLEFANNYLSLNFNFGPTLIGWLERNYPACYNRVVEAARRSREGCGHSNAIAQAYNHMIMPLASFQDRLTQALWGIKDFERRFGFKPEAMWLPETAACDDTLRLMIDLGMKYVILSPYQAEKVRGPGEEDWTDVSRGDMDPSRPYVWHDTLPHGAKVPGRSIAVFFYDGPLSKAAAFEGLMKNSTAFADRVEACFKPAADGPQLVSMAVDGETFGHHHKFAEMTLAHAFLHELPRRGIELVNFGRYLEDNPPQWEARIKSGPDGEGTAWSCAHGVRRWKGGCTCGTEGADSPNWRLPLRAALNTLRDAAAAVYSAEASKFFRDPWGARNDFAAHLPGPDAGLSDEFFRAHAGTELTKSEKKRALELLEMQKNAMFMFTSCGWFFSDISRIETMQNLRYAARVAEKLHDLGYETADKPFLSLLEMAHSNYPDAENGLKIYRRITAENALAREKSAALLIAGALLAGEPEESSEGSLQVEERTNRAGTLCLRGTVVVPGAEGRAKFAFCYLRHEEEFPLMFFTEPSKMPRVQELFACEDPAAMTAALEKESGLARVCFEDFTWEEKSLYAWILSDAARHSHAAVILKILDDYLYLLLRLPERTLASWAPLRSQAAAYARQAAEMAFKEACLTLSPESLEKLSALAARLKAAGLEAGFEPAPEAAAALAMKLTAGAIKAPSARTLLPLLHLLKTARALGAADLLFHLQNGLWELFTAVQKEAPAAECVPALSELYSLSDILIDRFHLKLDAMAKVPSGN